MSNDVTAGPQGAASNYASVAEIAGHLGVAEKTVRNYIRNGALPAVKLGRIVRVRLDAYATFLEQHRLR